MKKLIALLLSLSMAISVSPTTCVKASEPTPLKNEAGFTQSAKTKADVKAIPSTKEVKAIFVSNNKKVGSATVTIDADATTVTKNDVKNIMPKNYKFSSATNITSRNIVTVYVKPATTTISVRINYETSTGVPKGNERIDVPKKTLEISGSALKHIPEGFKVDSISAIKNNEVTVVVSEIATTKEIKVVFVNGKEKVSEAPLTVAADATTVTKDDVKDIMPEDFKFSSATNITSKNIVTVKVKPATISVRINYETSTGVPKGNERIDVPKKALEIQESALKHIPEGFKVDSISAIKNNEVTVVVSKIATTKEIKAVFVNGEEKVGEGNLTVAVDATTVTKDDVKDIMPEDFKFSSATNIGSTGVVTVYVKPAMISVRINYETSTGVPKGNERIDVPKKALEIQESALKHIPEGFKVDSISAIKNNEVTVVVSKIATTKEIKAVFVNGEEKVGEGNLTVAADATTVTENDVKDIMPENFDFESATNIGSTGVVTIYVKPITTPDPENPNPETPDPENPDPVNPDPVNPDPVNPDPVNPDPINPSPVNPDPINPSPETPNPETPNPVNPGNQTITPGTPDSSNTNTNIQPTVKASTPAAATSKADVPQTGDTNNMIVWIVLMAASVILLTVTTIKRKSKRKSKRK